MVDYNYFVRMVANRLEGRAREKFAKEIRAIEDEVKESIQNLSPEEQQDEIGKKVMQFLVDRHYTSQKEDGGYSLYPT